MSIKNPSFSIPLYQKKKKKRKTEREGDKEERGKGGKERN